MTAGVGPILERPAERVASRSQSKSKSSRQTPRPEGLRPPEDRAFDVATINGRLARMAAQASPPGRSIRR